jgi:hypothetical protein
VPASTWSFDLTILDYPVKQHIDGAAIRDLGSGHDLLDDKAIRETRQRRNNPAAFIGPVNLRHRNLLFRANFGSSASSMI